MLKVLNSLSEYEKIYNDFVVNKRIRGVTNFFINKRCFPKYINEGKVRYEVIDNTLFILVDQGEYYRLYYFGMTSDVQDLPATDKDVCCDVYEQQKNDAHTAFLHKILVNNNYICKQEYEQVRLFYGFLHNLSSKYLEKYKKVLLKLNLTMRSVSIDDKAYVENLILNNMSKYDCLSIEDNDWEEQVNNDNVVGLYNDNKIIALYYFSTKAGRIIVDKEYRGKNLSVLLRMYFASQKRWENSTNNQYGWAEANNIPSKKTFEKLFAIYTGKVKYRYVFMHTNEI